MRNKEKTANTDDWLRVTIGAIGNYEYQACHFSDLLIRALFDCDLNIAGYAAISLGKIGAKEAIPAMKKLMDSKEVSDLKPILKKAIQKLNTST